MIRQTEAIAQKRLIAEVGIGAKFVVVFCKDIVVTRAAGNGQAIRRLKFDAGAALQAEAGFLKIVVVGQFLNVAGNAVLGETKRVDAEAGADIRPKARIRTDHIRKVVKAGQRDLMDGERRGLAGGVPILIRDILPAEFIRRLHAEIAQREILPRYAEVRAVFKKSVDLTPGAKCPCTELMPLPHKLMFSFSILPRRSAGIVIFCL